MRLFCGTIFFVFALFAFEACAFKPPGYNLVNPIETKFTLSGDLELVERTDVWGPDITPLHFSLTCEEGFAHFSVKAKDTARYEVEGVVQPQRTTDDCSYVLTWRAAPFSFAIARPSGEPLFNSTGIPLFFADQYLHWGTRLVPHSTIYGLGERVGPLALVHNHNYTIFTRDNGGTPEDTNLNGAHPFYMALTPAGSAHGVFLLNSNAMEVYLGEEILTYKVIGGVLDFYVMTGATPIAVIQQYTDLIGRPHLPPFWSLGFHQCRWGYESLQVIKDVVANYSAAGLPLDTIWSDIDYMEGYKLFTVDPVRYNPEEFRAWVSEDIHSRHMHWVPIVDPALRVDATYEAFNDGAQRHVYIMDAHSGYPFIGQVWPNMTAWPDWTHPNTSAYWTEWLGRFREMVPWDGIWIDMNEPDSFLDGAAPLHFHDLVGADYPLPPVDYSELTLPKLPPYMPPKSPFNCKSIDHDAVQYAGFHYDLHSLYGWAHGTTTVASVKSILGTRPFVLSRSTFPSSGHYHAHWLGDNYSTFKYLKYSIAGMINFNMFGIPFVGADIGGFLGDCTPELLARWMQVGALSPFSRNHNAIGQISQEPYVFGDEITQISRKYLNLRYSLLAYLYTTMVQAHRGGEPVFGALSFHFPADPATHPIDAQFLLGEALMACPVVEDGHRNVSCYFPDQRWFDFEDGTEFVPPASSPSRWATISAPLDTMPLFQRGGTIVPRQEARLTSWETAHQNYTLLAALSADEEATGSLYVDDGESLDSVSAGKHLEVTFSIARTTFSARVLHAGYNTPSPRFIARLDIRGLTPPRDSPDQIDSVSLRVSPCSAAAAPITNATTYHYSNVTHVLLVDLAVPLGCPFELEWQWAVPAESPFPWLAVVAPVAGVVLLVIVILAFCCCCPRCCRTSKAPTPDLPATSPTEASSLLGESPEAGAHV